MRNQIQKGSSTLEILIAFAVLILAITSVIMVSFGNQSNSVDTQTNNEALYKAQVILEEARARSRSDYLSVITASSTEISGSLLFQKDLMVSDLTQCKKQATSTITWATTTLRSQKIELTSYFTDVAGALALGGDCIIDIPDSKWDNPQRFASDTYNPGKPTAIDVLKKIAYLGSDKTPFLFIADTKNATLGQTSGLFVTFANGFTLTKQPNALDAIHDSATNKNYLYAVMDDTSKQLNVIDVTDIYNPVRIASSTLSNVSPTGSFPQGWRVLAYKDRLYVINRETSTAEFHIFDISNPANPFELGTGTALNITIEAIAVQERLIGGTLKRYAFFATDQNSGELRVFDITDPSNTGSISEVISAKQDLSGNQDGASVFAIGSKLYFGRQSSTGADLYVFDISNPASGLPLLGSLDIGTGVLDIAVSGRFAFLTTPKTNKEVQIWDVSNVASITLIKEYNFANIVEQGIDYETDFLYATGQSTPNFQILHSP